MCIRIQLGSGECRPEHYRKCCLYDICDFFLATSLFCINEYIQRIQRLYSVELNTFPLT